MSKMPMKVGESNRNHNLVARVGNIHNLRISVIIKTTLFYAVAGGGIN
jgi:hypothetical protein